MDILTVTETKLDFTTSDLSINPNNYFVNRVDRNSYGGGVITYINPELNPSSLDQLQTKFVQKGLEVTITKLSFLQSRTVVIGVYRPPNSRHVWFDIFNELILDVLPHGKIILMGDLNCDLLRPNYCSTKSLLEALQLGNLQIKYDTTPIPTRITATSSTCIDFIAVDKSIEIDHYGVLDFSASDHLPVEASINVVIRRSISPVRKRSFKGVNFDDLGTKVASIHLNNVEDPSCYETQVESWSSSFIAILDEVAPIRSFPRLKKKAVWVDHDTKGLMCLRASITRKKRAGVCSIEDFDLDKRLKKCIKSRIRASIKEQGSIMLSKDDPKATWDFIRKTTFTQPKGTNYLPNLELVNDYFAGLVNDAVTPTASRSNTPAPVGPRRLKRPIRDLAIRASIHYQSAQENKSQLCYRP